MVTSPPPLAKSRLTDARGDLENCVTSFVDVETLLNSFKFIPTGELKLKFHPKSKFMENEKVKRNPLKLNQSR